MRLYHTGFEELRNPDIRHGRKNADFGQGFYLSDQLDFAQRWAKERSGAQTIVNTYALHTEGLQIKRLARNEEWCSYIFSNRHNQTDAFRNYDVIIGPIANDTIYDVMGIITSGFLSQDQSLQLLQIGPEYRQIAIKTEKAAAQLEWLSSRILTRDELQQFHELVKEEEKAYQESFAEGIRRIIDEEQEGGSQPPQQR